MNWQRRLVGVARDLRRHLLFPKDVNAVRGVFSSFDDANASAPRGRELGYDSEQHAAMYDYRLGQLFISDYAPLYWLSQIQGRVGFVHDLGGHVGVLYYGFRGRLKLPETLRWLVQDVPGTVARGRELARSDGSRALQFTSEWADGDGCDLLIASGVLQYLQWNLADRLQEWARKPRYILINNTPVYEGRDYITLQNTRLSYNPYRVFNRSGLVSSMERHGYVVRDVWRTERSLDVPFHPGLRVDSYQGFFMEQAA